MTALDIWGGIFAILFLVVEVIRARLDAKNLYEENMKLRETCENYRIVLQAGAPHRQNYKSLNEVGEVAEPSSNPAHVLESRTRSTGPK